jgi:Zinc knuckle
LDGRFYGTTIANFHIVVPKTTINFSSTMSSPKRPASAIKRPVPKQKNCGACGLFGHNRRKCPVVSAATAAASAAIVATDGNFENDVEEADSLTPTVRMIDDYVSYNDWGSFLYVIIDLETTGGTESSSWPRSI